MLPQIPLISYSCVSLLKFSMGTDRTWAEDQLKYRSPSMWKSLAFLTVIEGAGDPAITSSSAKLEMVAAAA